MNQSEINQEETQLATLAAGCFWCTEAIFRRLKGIKSVVPGYAGGYNGSPTYKQVLGGKTGHAEAIQITFDPKIIGYERLLEIFWGTHDPTTVDRQGNDVGHQYRSMIFYHNEKQRKTALALKEELAMYGKYDQPIVTEIVPYTNFFTAEEYHREFYEKNPSHAYCLAVIDPKIQQLLQDFEADVNVI